MKVFIAGAKTIKELDSPVKERLDSISKNGFDVLIGDCYGVDTSVQKYFSGLNYGHILVYSTGEPRNNVNNWAVKSIPAPKGLRGFDFFAEKDKAMARDADYGFMIWDGRSKGTLNNIINLVNMDKTVLIYLFNQKKMIVIKNLSDLENLINECPESTQLLYNQLSCVQLHF